MNIELRNTGHFEYIEEGTGEPLLLLHGLFGALSNWASVLDEFAKTHRVLIPLMPIYTNTKVSATVEGLAHFVADFVKHKELTGIHVLGNSLGGHIALLLALNHPERLATLLLTGSSGLFESGMGSGFPKRGDYQYIKDRVEYTFYNPQTATPQLVDEVFEIVNDSNKALRVIQIARAAQRQNMRAEIKKITVPTCLIWGLNDNITPSHVAHEFNQLIINSELHFIDHCGHAPMMENPALFNKIVRNFLQRHSVFHSVNS
ncbi:MAG: alpha/beta fold hydrolase [Bacteroidia bacterium]|nr:alpha/beta fold hydrolase [Bacteroidia bacterium]